MKYGESTFDILYLLFAIVSGVVILRRARNRTERLMGLAALILGCGDAFHLVPRVLNYFSSGDLSAALGLGKLVTSVTMTVFYGLLYGVWRGYYRQEKNKALELVIVALALLRIVLCLFPQNGWLTNEGELSWAILRNVPFVILGGMICFLYWKNRGRGRAFRLIWLYILLSFLFYIPVAVGAGFLPILGMQMLPKTVCYILMILAFLRATKEGK